MSAIAALTAATIGSSTTVDGLAVIPSAGGGLSVDIGPGSITALLPLDQTAYGSLPADTTDTVVKMGVNIATTTLALAAPGTSGTVISYLIEASFQESDVNPTVLPYYNAANPTQPFLGPNNGGAAQPTLRAQRVALTAKAGTPGLSGSQTVPVPDPGWVGLAAVTLAFGATSVQPGNILPWTGTRSIPFKLGDLRPGFSNAITFTSSGLFTVPANVTQVRVTVIGGGGAGGSHATLPGGGGGAGAWAISWLNQLVPGQVIPVTVGLGGVGQTAPQNGPNGGSSSFGTYITATGGYGGAGGTAITACAGGSGGTAFGGMFSGGGSCGTDAIPVAYRAGDGGGPGSGRGTTGNNHGYWGKAPGAGGGGAGAVYVNGSGQGGTGGNGANGIVVVEY